jgi:hypothetical protein
MASSGAPAAAVAVEKRLLGGIREVSSYTDTAVSEQGPTLTPQQRATGEAFASMVSGRLSTAALAELWFEPDNFQAVAVPDLYSGTYPFPLNWLLAYQAKGAVGSRAMNGAGARSTAKLYEGAAQGYKALAEQLGEKLFFCGDRPCKLDAHAYGHLAVVVHSPLPSKILKEKLHQHKNLVAFTYRMKVSLRALDSEQLIWLVLESLAGP